MQFVVIGYDGEDEQALERRLAAREAHLAMGDRMRDDGTMLYRAAILDDEEKMVGSVIVLEMDSRADVDRWLSEEPYVRGDVWKKIEVRPARVGPSFANLKAVRATT